MHLSQAPHKVVVEYLSAKKADLQNQLDYNWINRTGQDISNVLRGKIQMLDEVINLPNLFTYLDNLEKKIQKPEEGAKK